jgi:HK97 gp10 family phage protein
MANEGIKVAGLRQALKSLEAVGVPRDEIKAANNAAGEIVLAAAKPLVPVRSGRLVGTLRASKGLNKVTVSAGRASVPYANPIHWGWFKRNIKPQPFFVKALGYTREEVYQNYFRSLDNLIKQQDTKGTPTE